MVFHFSRLIMTPLSTRNSVQRIYSRRLGSHKSHPCFLYAYLMYSIPTSGFLDMLRALYAQVHVILLSFLFLLFKIFFPKISARLTASLFKSVPKSLIFSSPNIKCKVAALCTLVSWMASLFKALFIKTQYDNTDKFLEYVLYSRNLTPCPTGSFDFSLLYESARSSWRLGVAWAEKLIIKLETSNHQLGKWFSIQIFINCWWICYCAIDPSPEFHSLFLTSVLMVLLYFW